MRDGFSAKRRHDGPSASAVLECLAVWGKRIRIGRISCEGAYLSKNTVIIEIMKCLNNLQLNIFALHTKRWSFYRHSLSPPVFSIPFACRQNPLL